MKFFVEFYSLFSYNKNITVIMPYMKGEINMAKILPVSDLRNYNEVLKNCQKDSPVFLTKNGRGRFVVLDIEDYERNLAEKKLLLKLQEAEEAVRDESNWLTLEDLKKIMGE